MSLLLRCAIACGAAVSIAAGPAIAQRADPSEAVVFVRVFATISAEVDEFRKKVEKRGVELLTGTGVIVSPVGHVLTSYHLIDLQDRTLEHNGRKYDVSTTLERVEVVLSSGQRLDASVFGSDPENDLAVLTVSGGGELPFVPLGDSDAVERGTAVTAHGYPLGRSLDIGREQSDTDVPEATITPGAVSAIRDGEHDEAKFLQVTNALNPGNSGGPLIDEDGYAVGIVSMGARKAAGIGFAIPINRAKEFLEKVGLDSALPSRRLTLAASSSLPDKGLRLQLPQGYQDGLPGRLRVEAGDRAAGDPLLRVDRVFSRWTVAQIEQGLLAGGRVVSGPPYESEARGRRIAKGQISGRATRFDPDGRRTAMEYRIVPAGAEWIVARYEGPADALAFNRSVLRASLASIEVEPLLRADFGAPRWLPGRVEPTGWIPEPEGPVLCANPDAPPGFAWTSPSHFAVSARYALWAGVALTDLTPQCRGAKKDGSYQISTGIAGVSYALVGQLFQGEAGVVQIEFRVPREHEAAAVGWLREWRGALELSR